MKSILTGLVAAPFTPMHPDGSLHLEVVERQAARLVEDKVHGAFICGTTGEGLSLSLEERRQVAERWIAVAPAELKVIVHVGCNCISESRTLATHAAKIGASAVATIGPIFFRPPQVEQLVDYCAQIAEGAPSLPFYFYHFPAITGVDLPMLEFLQVAAKRIPNFAGIKFTDENLMSYAQCLNFERGRFNILFGRDEILLSALALGAPGAVGSTYNFMALLYHQLITAFQSGNLEAARSHQRAAVQIISVMQRFGGVPALKAMMKIAGLDCGPVRLPLRNLTSDEFGEFRGALEQVDFPLTNGRVQTTASTSRRSAGESTA